MIDGLLHLVPRCMWGVNHRSLNHTVSNATTLLSTALQPVPRVPAS